MDLGGHALAAGAALVGGLMNSMVGGGTLVTFPTLLALGVPPVAANVTNTVALCPGYLSGAHAQRAALEGQRQRVRRLVVLAVGGGVVGAALLLVTSDELLRNLVPVLMMIATGMLAAAPWLKRRFGGVAGTASESPADARWLPAAIGLVAVYGGFFGAGIGVMLLAVLGVGVHQTLDRSNAVKQVLSLAINLSAAAYFVFSGRVWWGVAAWMAVGGIIGGQLGGRLVGRMPPERFRRVVVVIGAVLCVVYAARTWA